MHFWMVGKLVVVKLEHISILLGFAVGLID